METLFFDREARVVDTYYVAVDDVVDSVENGGFLIFDGVNRNQMQFFAGQSLLEVFSELRTYFFSIPLNGQQLLEAKAFIKSGQFRSRWFQLSIADRNTDIPVNVIEETPDAEVSQGTERYIKSIKRISPKGRAHRILKEFFSWNHFTMGSKEEIALRITVDNAPQFYKLNLYRVGQGNLSAITNRHNVPLIYFDLGGGFAWNRFTYPTTIRLCSTGNPPVIISHWDMDHLETAKRYFNNPVLAPTLADKVWIAPQQHVSPSYFKIMSKMHLTGNLILWPFGLRGKIDTWFGKIIKCKGGDKNNSGLALIVTCRHNEIRDVLHPADAAYAHIPFTSRKKFEGLVATHHGAEFYNSNAPVPRCADDKIVYSYGIGNTYAHPRINSQNAHSSAGWIDSRDTNNGHISFSNHSVPHGNCGGGGCDLTLTNTF